MKTLIADSGSTKTDWALVENGNVALRVKTQGMNPLVMTEDVILRLLRDELLPALSDQPERVEFFGAGCRGKGLERMKATLQEVFGPACSVSVHSDLEGAAVALFGKTEGIACILGTGSNSGVWDGKALVANTPSMLCPGRRGRRCLSRTPTAQRRLQATAARDAFPHFLVGKRSLRG